jgi:hypothetical protein
MLTRQERSSDNFPATVSIQPGDDDWLDTECGDRLQESEITPVESVCSTCKATSHFLVLTRLKLTQRYRRCRHLPAPHPSPSTELAEHRYR